MVNELHWRINHLEEMSLSPNVTSLTNSRLLGVIPLKIKFSIPDGLKKQKKNVYFTKSVLLKWIKTLLTHNNF